MKKGLLLICLTLGIALWSVQVFAQADADRLAEVMDASKKEAPEEGWIKGGGAGLDFAQLALINPRVGGGANRIGFGGLANVFANYKAGKFAWDNSGSLQLAAQRIGGKNNPFEKNLDLLRLNSRAGYRLGEGKWFAAVDAEMFTLLLATYEGNVLKPEDNNADPIAKFLSPAQIMISPGLEYKHDAHLSFLYSPASLKLIYVGNDAIALLNVHGNEPGKNSFLQLGSNLKVKYNNTFLEDDRLSWASALDLYSNYLQSPENIDVQWTNELGFTIIKNLSLNLVTNLFYDDDINVQTDLDDDGIRGEAFDDVDLPVGEKRAELIPSVSFMQGLFIKYNLIF